AVQRFVNPVAVRDVAANTSFTGTHVDHVVVGSRNGNGSDGGDGLLVKERLPVCSSVGGSPHTSRSRAEIKHAGFTWDTGHCQYASAAKRSHLPPAHSVKHFLVHLRRRGRRCRLGLAGAGF